MRNTSFYIFIYVDLRKNRSFIGEIVGPSLFTCIFTILNREIRTNLKNDVLDAQKKLPGAAPGLAIVQGRPKVKKK